MTELATTTETLCFDLLEFYPDASSRTMGLETAMVLADLSMHKTVVRVGAIGRLRRMPEGLSSTVLAHLSETEKKLLDDLDKISIIDELHENPKQNIERLRQMLLAIVNDVRVVVIKLALQLIAMRHLAVYDEEKRNQLALQTRDIQAPLANRLGIAKLKWELEDLALRALEPTTYRLIATSLAEQRKEREDYVNQVVQSLSETLQAEGIQSPVVYGRAKHINSIFNKMKKKNKRLEEIYDLLAIRVQVDNLNDCYTTLGIVHALWQHIPSEFDDYIANPKPNGYQSLHTAVIGPEEKTIEIQIRTNAMHEYAELGVAAHWRYKESSTLQEESTFDKQINWLRSLLSEPDEALAEEFAAEITEDRVYTITPQGQVIDLPSGATPLDFAYYIHTDIGHRTRGARINGNLVPITHPLATGDTVEILTSKKPQPSRDWLNPHLGYLQSSKARAKVRHFFKQLERDKAILEGEELLAKQIKKSKFKIKNKQIERAVRKFNLKSTEDLYAALGFGDIGIISVMNYLDSLCNKKKNTFDDIQTRLARIPIRPLKRRKNSVIIEGIDDLLISIASCCHPVAPEAITGFISTTKGVRIHKSNCPNVLSLAATQPDKILPVTWAMGDNGFSAAVHIVGRDRIGLIRDLTQALINEGVTIQKANFGRDDDLNVNMQLQVTIRDVAHLKQALKKLNQVKSVQKAVRLDSAASNY